MRPATSTSFVAIDTTRWPAHVARHTNRRRPAGESRVCNRSAPRPRSPAPRPDPAPPATPPSGIFLGGWTVSAHVYVPGLPPGWACPEQPGFGETEGRFAAYVDWATRAGARHATRRVHLAGHSLGGAVAIAVAAREPGRVHRVTAFGPAGLPVEHGLRQAARDVVANGLGLRLGAGAASRSALRALDHPRAALRLAREVERLDLTRELGRAARDGRRARGGGEPRRPRRDAGDVPPPGRRSAAGATSRTTTGRDHLWVMTSPERLRQRSWRGEEGGTPAPT